MADLSWGEKSVLISSRPGILGLKFGRGLEVGLGVMLSWSDILLVRLLTESRRRFKPRLNPSILSF